MGFALGAADEERPLVTDVGSISSLFRALSLCFFLFLETDLDFDRGSERFFFSLSQVLSACFSSDARSKSINDDDSLSLSLTTSLILDLGSGFGFGLEVREMDFTPHLSFSFLRIAIWPPLFSFFLFNSYKSWIICYTIIKWRYLECIKIKIDE